MADKNKLKQKQLRASQVQHPQDAVRHAPSVRGLSVFRRDKHIYAQVIDDMAGKTLVAASSTQADVRGELKNGGNIAAAKRVGKAIAEQGEGGRHQGRRVRSRRAHVSRPDQGPGRCRPRRRSEVLTE